MRGKGLLAPQNTFLDTIATRFDGTRKLYLIMLSFILAFDIIILRLLVFILFSFKIKYFKIVDVFKFRPLILFSLFMLRKTL